MRSGQLKSERARRISLLLALALASWLPAACRVKPETTSRRTPDSPASQTASVPGSENAAPTTAPGDDAKAHDPGPGEDEPDDRGGGAGTATAATTQTTTSVTASTTATAVDPAGTGRTLAESLRSLGVDTTRKPRTDRAGKALPEDYAPLGARRFLGKHDELFLGAVRLTGAPKLAAFAKRSPAKPAVVATADQPAKPAQPAATEILQTPAVTTWLDDAYRRAAAADADGDGVEELVTVRLLADKSVLLEVFDDRSKDFALLASFSLGKYTATGLALVGGDFDGDGRDEAAVAITSALVTKVVIIDKLESQPVVVSQTVELQPVKSANQVSIRLESGNVDYDARDELAIVMNEAFEVAGSPSGLSRYFIRDDLAAGLASLKEGDLIAQDGGLRAAVVGDVAIGDIDGDNVGEVVLGGITNMQTSGNQPLGELALALDDAAHDFATLGAKYLAHYVHGDNDINPNTYRTAFVMTGDLDGDLIDEIVVNHYVFDDFVATKGLSSPFGETDAWVTLNDDDVMPASAGFPYSDRYVAMAVADVTYDGYEDILVHRAGASNIAVFGFVPKGRPNAGSFRRLDDIPIEAASPNDPHDPLLVPINVDGDSAQVVFQSVGSDFVFTEPLLIAAVAAPPCHASGGQSTDACVTSFGESSSTTVSKEETLTISASAHVGISIEDRIFSQSALEVEASITTAIGLSRNSSYALEESITYATGPLEDGVIFTTLPYDRYVYKITSHPDASLIGREVVVSLPRSPITLKVERSFYNAHVSAGSIKVDDAILRHVPGDISSYPTKLVKESLLRQHGGFGSKDSISVGQGTGSTELSLSLAEDYGTGRSLEVGAELSVRVTSGGVMAGFTVGSAVGSSLSVVNGKSRTYTGVVGDLDAGSFADKQYRFGLFTYYYEHPSGQKFEVLNYWVDR